MLAVTRHWPAVPSNGSVAAVLELVAEGDASVLDAIATGATSDQARATAWPVCCAAWRPSAAAADHPWAGPRQRPEPCAL